MRSFPRSLVPLVATLLGACGGGDSTGPGTQPPPPTQRLDIVPAGGAGALPGLSGKALAIAPGDSARLAAVVNASNGTTATPSDLTWSATNDVVSIDGTGLVRAAKLGSSAVVARTATLADTVAVTVSSCGAAQAVTLAVGQAATYPAGQGASLCITSTGSEEYTLVAFNGDLDSARATNDTRVPVNVKVTGTGAAPVAALLPGITPSFSRAPATGLDANAPRRDAGFDARLRRVAARTLAPRMQAARLSAARLGPSPAVGVRRSVAAAVPTVGQLLKLNAGLEPCDTTVKSGFNRRVGRVVAITERAIVVADTGNPSGGFTDAEYRGFGLAFDTLAYPVDVANFGAEKDVDGNGRSIIFFTRAVNAMTPINSGFYVAGFFYERDLFQNTTPKSDDYCGASNFAEMFYMYVPDPARNETVFSKPFVASVTIGTLAHEFQHLINASRRLYVNNADDWENTWLNEGLSHVAEELVFYRAGGVSPRAPRLDASAITTAPAVRSSFNTYMNAGNISRLTTYFQAAEGTSPYAENDELETRGATWQFLRYAADRVNGSDAALWQKLVANTKLNGMPNLQAALGVNAATLSGWLRDWAIANYVDGLTTAPLDPRFTFRSWDFRSVIGGLKLSNQQPAYPVYPLAPRTLVDGNPSVTAVRPGAAAYFRFAVPAGKQARLTTNGNGPNGSVGNDILLSLVRIK